MLDIKGSIWNQKLDYWKILFKYFGCRQGGHNIHDFLVPTNTTHPIRKIWVKNLPRMVKNKEGEGFKKKGDGSSAEEEHTLPCTIEDDT